MNEQTSRLIEQLAEQLGTTTEYLWEVLLSQAPIEATIILMQFLAVIVFGVFLWRIHKKLSKPIDPENEYSQTRYGKYEEGAIIPMAIGLLLFFTMFLINFFSIEQIISGYFNPEYWALDKILNIGVIK